MGSPLKELTVEILDGEGGEEYGIKCFKQISAFKQEKLVEIKYK